MQHLFQLHQGVIVISPDVLNISSFRNIWVKDPHPYKDNAIKDISYVYYIVDFCSPYAKLSVEERTELTCRDVLLNPNYIPSSDVRIAMKKYAEIMDTPNIRLYLSVEKAKESINRVIETTASSGEGDDSNLTVEGAASLIKLVIEAAAMADKTDKLYLVATKERSDSIKQKGGTQATALERGDFNNIINSIIARGNLI